MFSNDQAREHLDHLHDLLCALDQVAESVSRLLPGKIDSELDAVAAGRYLDAMWDAVHAAEWFRDEVAPPPPLRLLKSD